MKNSLKAWVCSGKCFLYLALGTVGAMLLARAIGSKMFLPVAMTLVIYPVYALDLSQGRRDLAFFHTFFWALVASVTMICLVRYDDGAMAKVVFKSVSYRDEMFRWILTGEGPEGNVKLFLPQHMKNYIFFCASSLLTAGVWGLAFGTILLNYMNFYVGSLSLHAHHPLIVYVFGWPVWSLLRVVGFMLCGIALSEPVLSQFFRYRLDSRKNAQYFLAGLVFILLDILLKATLASFWRTLLRGAVSF
ncbi:MAG: hypothetical protein ABH845_01630 [Candidatus Omnitrophota bacterium]